MAIRSPFFTNPSPLGLLSGYLLAASAPSTDPGAFQRTLGEGLLAYQQALRDARQEAWERQYGEAQLGEITAKQKEREAQTRREESARRLMGGVPAAA